MTLSVKKKNSNWKNIIILCVVVLTSLPFCTVYLPASYNFYFRVSCSTIRHDFGDGYQKVTSLSCNIMLLLLLDVSYSYIYTLCHVHYIVFRSYSVWIPLDYTLCYTVDRSDMIKIRSIKRWPDRVFFFFRV